MQNVVETGPPMPVTVERKRIARPFAFGYVNVTTVAGVRTWFVVGLTFVSVGGVVISSVPMTWRNQFATFVVSLSLIEMVWFGVTSFPLRVGRNGPAAS
jgi:hypothetical protein